MQVVMNKRFVLNPEKTLGTDPSCRFREERKNSLTPTRLNLKIFSLRLGDVIFSELECVGVERFLRFSRKLQDRSAPIFSGFKRKYLFSTTCIEKYCTGPLNTAFDP